MFKKFFSDNHTVYEIMWKNIIDPEATDDIITRRMHIA